MKRGGELRRTPLRRTGLLKRPGRAGFKPVTVFGSGDKGRATELHSRIVRARNVCEASRNPLTTVHDTWLPHVCVGGFDTAHYIRRGYGHVRCELRNAFCFCRLAHTYFGDHHDEFDDFALARMGGPLFDRLHERALFTSTVDWAQVVRYLTIVAESRGVPV